MEFETLFLCLLFLLINVCKINALPDRNSVKYLVKFGYLRSMSDGDSEEALSVGLQRFQYFANLPVTGELDSRTIQQFKIPRCANKDPVTQIPSSIKVHPRSRVKINRLMKKRRGRRWVHQGSKWTKYQLTWKLVGRGRTLDHNTILISMRQAFKFWSDVTNLDFIEMKESDTRTPDIWVKFVRYSHGDPYAFDGEGGTLAHAFYPHNQRGLSGDIHFDDDEEYTVKSPYGRNLLWVATHEIGHSIGMEHSNVRDAVMYPWYTAYKPGFNLRYDDVHGIQSLYGSRQAPKTTLPPTQPSTQPPTRPPTRPPIISPGVPKDRSCIKGVTATYYNQRARMNVIMTSGNKIALIRGGDGIDMGPFDRQQYIPFKYVSNPIDAAFGYRKVPGKGRKEHTIFFSRDKYYIFAHFRYVSGPHSIYGGRNPLGLNFGTWVKKIDAAFTWHRNKKIYFFSREYYWRYNTEKRRLDAGYPRRISDAWKGLPRGKSISTAMSDSIHKTTFFVYDDMLYRMNDETIRVNEMEHVGKKWLNCGGVGAMRVGGLVGGIGTFSMNEPRARDP